MSQTIDNKAYREHGLKWGVILGLITGVIHYILYFTNMRFALSTGLWISFGIAIALLVVEGLQARKISGNGLSYGKAFSTLFLTILVSSVLFIGTEYLVKNYVAPSKVDEEKVIKLEQNAKLMERFGADDEKIEEATEKMAENDFKPTLLSSIGQLIGALVVYSILILIIAAIVRKKAKETAYIDPETT